MSLIQMILCSKSKNVLWKIVTKSQVVTKFNVAKSRLHRTIFETSRRFLRSHTYIQTIRIQVEKNNSDLETRNLQESLFIWQLAVCNLMFGFAVYYENAGNL